MTSSHEFANYGDDAPMPEPPPYLERQVSRSAPRAASRTKYTNREHQGAPAKDMVVANVDLPPVDFDEQGNWLMRTPEQEMAFIRRLKASGALPEAFQNDVQISFAIQALKAGGMNVFSSIGHVAFIYGRYTEFDDVPLAKVIRTGLLEHHDEYGFTLGKDGGYLRMAFENGNLHLPAIGAVCEVKRLCKPIYKFAYTADQAKRNGAINKKGAWTTDPLVMMIRKARSRAFNKIFADVLYSDAGALGDAPQRLEQGEVMTSA